MQLLKADTLTKVLIGPAVAVGDGFTPVTTLAVSTADEAEILKHDAAAVTDISGNTFAAITSADGYYNLTITAAQLDTEGRLTVIINDDSLILPIRCDFMVVNANVFDSLYAAAATDYLQVDQLQLGGSTQSATDLKDFADAGYDPATNKVQGVVLVDTTTTNTDMRGTDSAALASVATEARLSELDAGTAGKMANQVDIVQTDTTTDIPALIATAQADLDIITGTDGVTLATAQALYAPAKAGDNMGTVTSVTGAVGSVTGNVGGNVVGSTASVTGAVGSVTGNVGGNVVGSVGSVVGHTAQTGDTFALANGASGFVATKADTAAILVDTGTTLPALIDDLAVKKNTAFPNFEFLMVLTSDHVTPATGLTVTGQRSIDGGAFAAVSGAIAEVSNGIYQFDAVAADTNGDLITWRFSSATADDTFVTFKTVA